MQQSNDQNRYVVVYNSFGNVLYSRTTSERFFPLPRIQTMSLLSVIHRNTTNFKHVLSKIKSGDEKNVSFFEKRDKKSKDLLMLFVVCSEKYDVGTTKICQCMVVTFCEFIDLCIGNISQVDINEDFSSFIRKLNTIDETLSQVLSPPPSAIIRMCVRLPQISTLVNQRRARTNLNKMLKNELQYWQVGSSAIFVDGEVVVCSEDWKIKSKRVFLELYTSFLHPATARDIPLYLGKQKGRLLSVKINRRVEIMYFCGAKPYLEDIIQNIQREAKKWSFVETDIPNERFIKLEKSIRCVLFVQKKSFFFFDIFSPFSFYSNYEQQQQEEEDQEEIETNRRLGSFEYRKKMTLKMTSFYADVTEGVFKNNHIPGELVRECYFKQKKYSYYALANRRNQEIYIIMDDQAPKFAVRPIAQDTFRMFSKLSKIVEKKKKKKKNK